MPCRRQPLSIQTTDTNNVWTQAWWAGGFIPVNVMVKQGRNGAERVAKEWEPVFTGKAAAPAARQSGAPSAAAPAAPEPPAQPAAAPPPAPSPAGGAPWQQGPPTGGAPWQQGPRMAMGGGEPGWRRQGKPADPAACERIEKLARPCPPLRVCGCVQACAHVTTARAKEAPGRQTACRKHA